MLVFAKMEIYADKNIWRLVFIVGQIVHLGSCVVRWDVFASKTLYEWAHDVRTPPIINEYNHIGMGNTLCKAIHVNMVVRHGARNPTKNNLVRIKDLHHKIVHSKDPNKFPELNNWVFRYDMKKEGELVSKGISELNGLGQRVGERFHHLFDTNGQYVKFVSSRKSRAKESAKYFHNGLLDFVKNIPSFNNEINNHTMRFYDDCYNYENQVEENEAHFKQFHDFSKTSRFTNIAKSLQSKLGINFSLTDDDVYQIYELCSYEKYIYEETTWCDLLTDADRQVLEYGQDIEKYLESSYGHPINSAMACPLVRDMFETMDGAINNTWNYDSLEDMTNTSYLAGKFQFGHAETLVPLMTALGLFKDKEPLLATNFDTMTNRFFRTSKIVPYASNVAFVVYACDNMRRLATQVFTAEDQEFVVKLFVNEREVTIPACDEWSCHYEKVRQKYADYINKCDMTKVCGSKPENGANILISYTPLTWILAYILTLTGLHSL